MIVQLSYAQTRAVGVAEGDWFKYGFTFDWNSELNMTSEEVPFSDFLMSEWVTLNIQDISGTNVTGCITIHFENGTDNTQDVSVDVDTGDGNLRNWLISAGLNANDLLYLSGSNERINETITQTSPWGSRETNHLVYSYNYSSEEDNSDIRVNMFWDKEIGVLTELSFEADALMNGTAMSASALWTIVDSNIETIPEFDTSALIIVTVSMTILILWFKREEVNAHIERLSKL